MNYGIQNEYDFVELFNGKYFRELDNNSKLFLRELFKTYIDDDTLVQSWKNKVPQKADIFIKIGNYTKGVSLKCGNSNSMHHEPIQEFKRYLEKLGIPYSVIDKYVGYHYGYGKDSNGKIDFSKVLSSDEYKQLYQNEIFIFNSYINKTRIIVDMIDRFIIRGRNSDYDIDALVCGTIDDYVWILKEDLYDLILSKRCIEFTSPHIACLTIGPKKRNLDGKSNNYKERYIVCIRWNYIKEDILSFKNTAGNGCDGCLTPSSVQNKNS